VVGSNPSRDTGYPDWGVSWFFSDTPRLCPCCFLTNSFQFICYPAIWCYILWLLAASRTTWKIIRTKRCAVCGPRTTSCTPVVYMKQENACVVNYSKLRGTREKYVLVNEVRSIDRYGIQRLAPVSWMLHDPWASVFMSAHHVHSGYLSVLPWASNWSKRRPHFCSAELKKMARQLNGPVLMQRL
jgi:hypothetical protein